MLDYHKLKKQEGFNELSEISVIFITENNLISDSEKIYNIDCLVKETNKEFGNGNYIIYVNGSYKGEEGKTLDDLIHDFFVKILKI